VLSKKSYGRKNKKQNKNKRLEKQQTTAGTLLSKQGENGESSSMTEASIQPELCPS
jgi:hypothetical protein